MLLRELGLTAYFPAVAPVEHAAGCPDALAIACYESPETYDESLRSVGGRVHALLHDSLFRPADDRDAGGSWDAFLQPLPALPALPAQPTLSAPPALPAPSAVSAGAAESSPSLRARAAYHLFDAPIDWYGGLTRLCVGLRDPAKAADAEAFRAQLLDACLALRAAPGSIDGAILAVDDDYFAFWDHRAAAAPGDDAPLQRLSDIAGQVVMRTQASDICGNGALFESWAGLPLKGGECYRLTFERRSFFPW